MSRAAHLPPPTGRGPTRRPRRGRLRRAVAALAATLLAFVACAASATPALAAADSQGTDFWLSFPSNNEADSALQLFITGPRATSGTVTVPGQGFTRSFSIVPGVATKVTLPYYVQLATFDGVERKGIHVTSGDEVSVYGLNSIEFTSDAFLGLPTDILGTEYVVLSYPSGNGPEFSVAATQDGTMVTIIPSASTESRTAGVPYNVFLNAGDTYQLRAEVFGPDLTGTIVTSTKPVAVFSGNACTNVPTANPYCDHLVEEMTPPTTWGKSFVTLPLATRTHGDTFRVLAAKDNTHVLVNGSQVATLNRGKVFETMLTTASRITSDQPILVAQYANGSTFDGVTGDPFVMLIPPYEQFMSQYTISTAGSEFAFASYVNLVVPTATVGQVKADGAPVPSTAFRAIPGSTFSGAQLSVSVGSHSYTGPEPFGVYVYGFASYDSYGYPGGLSLAPVATVTSVTVTPPSGSGITGSQQCKTATVRDQNGNPVPGVRVDFAVSGANTASGSVVAGTDGVAAFCYTGSAVGNDTVRASVGTVSGTASATWTPADVTPPTLTGTPTTQPNAAGWYSGDVTVHWTATDSGSGVDPTTMPADKVLTGEGRGLTATASVKDRAGNTATAVSAPPVNIDRTAPVTTASAPAGWTRGAKVTLAAADGLSGVDTTYASLDGAPAVAATEVSITSEGTHTLSFHSVDKAGNTEADTTVTVRVDATAPTITHAQSPAANARGWNNTPVRVTFSCNDSGSGLASCTPAAADITDDGFGQQVTGTATDNAGNTATDLATVNLDQRAPGITAAVPAPNAHGWYNTRVPVTFTCTDTLSGVASCPTGAIDRDGRGQSVTGTATDAAGNTANASVSGINLDTVAPTIAAAADHEPNAAGWYHDAVTVAFTCADELSGVSTCTAPVTLAADGADQSVTGQAVDEAGNGDTATIRHIAIDTTAPVISAAVSGEQTDGYYTGPVTVRFTCADATSGVASCPATVTLDRDGVDQSVTRSVTDVAGNTASLTVGQITIDTEGPQITGAATTRPNAAGWYAGDVTVHFDCTDATSGIASCTEDRTVTGDADDHRVTGTATDRAGHSASTTVGPIRIDTTAPLLSGVPTGAPDSGHWYRGDVTIRWTASDTGSGIDESTRPADSVITGEGEGLYASASVTDLAGNSVTAASGAVDIDRTAPVTRATVPVHWVNTDVAVDLTATDALSGVAGTHYSVDGGPAVEGTHVEITAEGVHELRFWSTDVAGNVESHRTVVVRLDKSAPTIVDRHDPEPNGNGWNATDVTVSFVCDDTGGSGVASCSDPVTLTDEATAAPVTGTVTDNAGNSASDTTTVSIDKTKPTIAATVPAANDHGWYRNPVTVTFSCADERSGVATCSGPATFGLDGAGQGTDGLVEDRAGNGDRTLVRGVNIDTVAPTVAAGTTAVANGAGWYKTPVTVTFACADELSGIDSCTAPVTLDADGAGQRADGRAVDNAGNAASAALTGVNVDTTGPVVTARVVGTRNGNGWYSGSASPVQVRFTCSDATSGVASCPADMFLVRDGADQSVQGTAYDVAGNATTVTLSDIDVDSTPPTITAKATPAANANGWRNTDVTVTFTCGDATSGVASCPAPVTVGEGAAQTVTGTVVDKAGNTGRVTVAPIDVDKTAPVVTYTGNQGTYTIDQTVNITCAASDALSGVASTTCADITGPAYLFAVGDNAYSASAVDKADNTGSATTHFTVQVSYGSLGNVVDSLSSDPGVASALNAKLSAALAAEQRGNLTAMRNQLDAFANEVDAQTGKAFTAEEAALIHKLLEQM